MIAVQCPERDNLYQYSVGLLSDAQSEEIAVHLDGCLECQSELLTLSDAGDTLVGQLRSPIEDAFLKEPLLDAAVAEALAMPRGADGDRTESCSVAPRVLGEYELLDELGRGGMGRVYRARHTKLDRVVALKILPRGRLEDSGSLARFAREMRAIGQLDHPHVVHAYDGREIDEMPVLVMEYVEGMDLGELVRRLGRLEPEDASELVRQAALGLQYAHERGLVHRDVKPSNLMLTRSGIVKLLDLGLARFYSEPVGEEVTGAGQMMGTADYVAPEQVGDSRAVDIRADIYSLGCTFYKLLSGRAPYGGPEYRGALEKMNAHLHRPVPPIGELASALPAALVAVLERMLAKQPEARFATPAEVVDALRPFCAGANPGRLIEQAEQTHALPTFKKGTETATTAGSAAHLPLLASLPARCRCSWQWLIATGFVLLLLAAGFAAGVIITIYKNDQATQVEVPDESQVRIDPKGDVQVTLPGTEDATGSAAAFENARSGAAAMERSDVEALQGVWQVESGQDSGRRSPAEMIASLDLKFVFNADRYQQRRKDGVDSEGRYSLDTTTNPKTITLFPDGTAEPIKGIYRLGNNRLTIVLNEKGGNERPREFISEPDSSNDLLIKLSRSEERPPSATSRAGAEEVIEEKIGDSASGLVPQAPQAPKAPRTPEHPEHPRASESPAVITPPTAPPAPSR